jgi:integrase
MIMGIQLSFLHNRRKNNAIELVIYQTAPERKRTYLPTGVKCLPAEWNERVFVINSEDDGANTNNIVLTNLKTKVHSLINKQLLEFGELNTKKLTADFKAMKRKKEAPDKEVKLSFTQYIKYTITNGGLSNLSHETKKNYFKVIRKLEEASFDNVAPEEVTPLFLNKFDKYLKGIGQEHNTRWSYFKNIRSVLNIAVRDKVISPDQFPFNSGGFQIKYKTPQKTALTLEELKKIEDTDTDERLEIIKDMFLLSCYTGLRFSDINKLCAEMLKESSGKAYLVVTNQKGQRANNIPVTDLFNGKPLLILKKYKEKHAERIYSFKWFNLSNMYVNRELKTLQRWAKVETRLTFHVARHSCCTFLVADFKVPPSVAQKILGHSTLRMTEQYLHVRGSHIEDSLKGVKWD